MINALRGVFFYLNNSKLGRSNEIYFLYCVAKRVAHILCFINSKYWLTAITHVNQKLREI